MAGSEYEKIVIVGLGLMGGSLALSLRRSGFRGRIAGVSSPPSLAEGQRLGVLDEAYGYDDLPLAVSGADLVVLATPIFRIINLIGQIGALGRSTLKPGTVVTDVGSTKREILLAAERSLPPGIWFIGGHPMAGSEKRGAAAADPFLFQNAYYILTPGKGAPREEADRLAELVSRTGARVIYLSAEDHDRIAAAISHLPQLLAVSLVNSLGDLGPLQDTAVRLAAGGFRNMTRIASSPFEIWRDIVATNRACIAGSLRRFQERLGDVISEVAAGEKGEKRLAGEFQSAGITRAAIPRDTKGFLHTLWDLLVVVEDKPGVIAGIAGVLASRGINIQDIEVVKVREGEGGSLRLGFATRELAAEALRLLGEAGYSGRLQE